MGCEALQLLLGTFLQGYGGLGALAARLLQTAHLGGRDFTAVNTVAGVEEGSRRSTFVAKHPRSSIQKIGICGFDAWNWVIARPIFSLLVSIGKTTKLVSSLPYVVTGALGFVA